MSLIGVFQDQKSFGFMWGSGPGATGTWTNMPAAVTELLGATTRRVRLNLSKCRRFRMSVEIVAVGTAGAVLGLGYSLDDGVTWSGLDNGTAGSNSTATVSMAATGWVISTEALINAAARTTVLVTALGSGGDGVADPQFRNHWSEFY